MTRKLAHTLPAAFALVLAFPAAAQQQAQALPAPAVSAGSMLQVALGLGLVLAMVAGAAWLLRRLAGQPGRQAGAIRVIGGAAVGQRERVVLVEIGATWLVVGVAPGHVSALHTMPRAELPPAAGVKAGEAKGFAAWLKQVSERRQGE